MSLEHSHLDADVLQQLQTLRDTFPETTDEYAARHREQARTSRSARLMDLALHLDDIAAHHKEDSEHTMSGFIPAAHLEPHSIVGVGGLLTSGKDAFADYLVAQHGYTKLFMSEPLHDWLLTQNPWFRLDKPIECMEGWTFEPGEFHTYAEIVHQVGYTEAKEQTEVRRALQRIGTDCGRKMIDEQVWVQAMQRKVGALLQQAEELSRGARVVITGIRYENELKMMQRLGGETVWVERPSARAAHAQRLKEDSESATGAVGKHSSELGLERKDFDSEIHNAGSLADLGRKSDTWLDIHRTVPVF